MSSTEFWLLIVGMLLTMASILVSVLTVTPSNWWAFMVWMITCACLWGLVLYQEVKGLPVTSELNLVTRDGD